MPVIKMWCMPNLDEDGLYRIRKDITSTVLSIPELELKYETDVTCIFIPAMSEYRLNEEIIVEIYGLFEKPERTKEVRERLACKVANVAQAHFPHARVECFVYPFNPEYGFWTSADTADPERLPDDGHNFRDGVEQGPRT